MRLLLPAAPWEPTFRGLFGGSVSFSLPSSLSPWLLFAPLPECRGGTRGPTVRFHVHFHISCTKTSKTFIMWKDTLHSLTAKANVRGQSENMSSLLNVRASYTYLGWLSWLKKHLSSTAGDTRDVSSIPGLGRSPGEENGNPLWYSCLENPLDRGAWRATVHRIAESDTTEHTCMHTERTDFSISLFYPQCSISSQSCINSKLW